MDVCELKTQVNCRDCTALW